MTINKVTKLSRVKVDLLDSIQVAKEGSVYFYTKLAIIKCGDKYKVLKYNKPIPNNNLLVMDDCLNQDYSTQTIDKYLANSILSAIRSYKESASNNEHTQPYTYLVAYTSSRGINLFDEGVLSK